MQRTGRRSLLVLSEISAARPLIQVVRPLAHRDSSAFKSRADAAFRDGFLGVHAGAAEEERRLAIVHALALLPGVVETAAHVAPFNAVFDLSVQITEIPDHYPRLISGQCRRMIGADVCGYISLQELEQFLSRFQVDVVFVFVFHGRVASRDSVEV